MVAYIHLNYTGLIVMEMVDNKLIINKLHNASGNSTKQKYRMHILMVQWIFQIFK